MPTSTTTVRSFLPAVARLDVHGLISLLTPEVCLTLPLAASDHPEPAAVFEGRDDVVGVYRAIADFFVSVEFHDVQTFENKNGSTVFVECRSVREHRNRRVYRNIYVFRFDVKQGLIVRITEYSNPVTFAKFFGRPIG